MNNKRPGRINLKPHRIEGLSDGAFAIVMTLLGIELAVPVVPELLVAEQLGEKLLDMWPKFMFFGLSFIVLGIFWFLHHLQFHYIKRSDGGFAWLNIIFLMFVALIPFSTAMLGEYSTSNTIVVVFYGINMFIALLMLNILWWYATWNRRLVDSDLNPRRVRSMAINLLIGVIIFLAAIGISFINPYLGIVIYSLLALEAIIRNILMRRRKSTVEQGTENDYGISRKLIREVISELGIKSGYGEINDLEKLSELKDRRIITEKEFMAKKKLILGI